MCDEGPSRCGCEPEPKPQLCVCKPSLFSRVNCVPCNRLFFFLVGAGIAIYYDKVQREAEKLAEEAKQEAGKKGKRKNKNKNKDKKK
ncbi:uncharacterized protein LOC115620150 [Scaptodrosophila lebanonensis]|uniref:Uncharacterized protein LOC115620150 n=1 Tax=Drosophila lebanonensis TaxID=7225 RepID=A0A6J2SYY6_DROLE|nr:uncharacterized protein LOC115620150 [Scaptodrosophila lebanonensis]